MTIEIHGHVESLSTGPMSMIAVTIRLASARSQELLTVFASKEELSTLYHPGKGIALRITPKPMTEAAPSAGAPVAWLHANHSDAYVITDRVKNIWLNIDPRHVEHYTIPLYRSPSVSLLREPIGVGPSKVPPIRINKPRGFT